VRRFRHYCHNLDGPKRSAKQEITKTSKFLTALDIPLAA
jgi:hypothetical protein